MPKPWEERIRVLIGCEYTATVRDAFRALGHDAWSCDLDPTEGDPQFHLQCDVLSILDREWDLAIFHPPCTDLAVSGARWFKEKGSERQEAALDFVRQLLDAPIPRIALENPVSVISSRIRKPDQIIHPFFFGDPERKKTCFWLKNLPKLAVDHSKINWYAKESTWRMAPSATRGKDRSRTFPSIAREMARQWGGQVNPDLGAGD